MPCRCDGYNDPKDDEHNGPVAEMLCAIMQDHEARGEMSCFNEKQLAWWAEHKARDKARLLAAIESCTESRAKIEAKTEVAGKYNQLRLEAKERARQDYLETLTPYERKLLEK